jgi:LPXTG-motif cell wall-anchored protein
MNWLDVYVKSAYLVSLIGMACVAAAAVYFRRRQQADLSRRT